MNRTTSIALFAIGTVALGSLSGIATAGAIDGWYATLNKPSFQPPNWLFGPAWTILYLLIGSAAGIVWIRRKDDRKVKNAMKWFFAQLLLNLMWTPLFFGLQQPDIALLVIILLVICSIICAIQFHRIKQLAGYLFIPYLLWICFATALNAAIVYLN